jgi:hypothetical protein
MGYHTFDVSFPCIIQLALFPKPMVLGKYETKRVKEDDDLSDRGKKLPNQTIGDPGLLIFPFRSINGDICGSSYTPCPMMSRVVSRAPARKSKDG